MRGWFKNPMWWIVALLLYVSVVVTVDAYRNYQRDLKPATPVPAKRGR